MSKPRQRANESGEDFAQRLAAWTERERTRGRARSKKKRADNPDWARAYATSEKRGSIVIFLNAETIPPLGSSPDPERVKVPGNYTKEESIAKYKQENAVKAWEDMAKDPLQAQVFIITLLPEWEQDPIILLDRDEAALVEHFDRWIQRNCQTSAHGWVTWNGLHFDYPLLQLRGLKYGAKRVAYEMRASRYPTDRHDDLSKLFPPFTSLDAAAAFLGIPNDNPIPGSEIRRRFDADDFEAIYAHTRSRVTLLREMKKRGA